MIPAHIAGLPIEETFATLAPALGILAVFVAVWLRRLAALLRRGKPGKSTR